MAFNVSGAQGHQPGRPVKDDPVVLHAPPAFLLSQFVWLESDFQVFQNKAVFSKDPQLTFQLYELTVYGARSRWLVT